MTAINELDIRSVDKDILVDADDVQVDLDAPKPERMNTVLKQTNGNYRYFKCKNEKGDGYVAVEVTYADTSLSVDDCFEDWMRTC